jgi:hypothetical protein
MTKGFIFPSHEQRYWRLNPTNKQRQRPHDPCDQRRELEKGGWGAAAGVNAQGKLAQSDREGLFANNHELRPNQKGRDNRFIDGAVVMPRTRGALLITAGGIVMMGRSENGAHAQVEQTNDRCYGSHHSDDAGT